MMLVAIAVSDKMHKPGNEISRGDRQCNSNSLTPVSYTFAYVFVLRINCVHLVLVMFTTN